MTEKIYTHTLNPHKNLLSCGFQVLEHEPYSDTPDVIASGFVKLDGCVNWNAGNPTDDGRAETMVHFCDPSDLQGFMAELQAAIHAAHSLCKDHEKDYWKPTE